MKVKCPTCGKETEFSPQNVVRPFCSERCQTLDLGAWADETYAVPVSVQENNAVNAYSGAAEGEFAPEQATPPKHQLN